jgi:hypothetical protein
VTAIYTLHGIKQGTGFQRDAHWIGPFPGLEAAQRNALLAQLGARALEILREHKPTDYVASLHYCPMCKQRAEQLMELSEERNLRKVERAAVSLGLLDSEGGGK